MLSFSTFLAAKRWSQKAATAKSKRLGYRTGSTHWHADRLARAGRGRPTHEVSESFYEYGERLRHCQLVPFAPDHHPRHLPNP